eukprot:scaffold1940_cov78-Phaeocystis_antarctica.AAC.5
MWPSTLRTAGAPPSCYAPSASPAAARVVAVAARGVRRTSPSHANGKSADASTETATSRAGAPRARSCNMRGPPLRSEARAAAKKIRKRQPKIRGYRKPALLVMVMVVATCPRRAAPVVTVAPVGAGAVAALSAAAARPVVPAALRAAASRSTVAAAIPPAASPAEVPAVVLTAAAAVALLPAIILSYPGEGGKCRTAEKGSRKRGTLRLRCGRLPVHACRRRCSVAFPCCPSAGRSIYRCRRSPYDSARPQSSWSLPVTTGPSTRTFSLVSSRPTSRRRLARLLTCSLCRHLAAGSTRAFTRHHRTPEHPNIAKLQRTSRLYRMPGVPAAAAPRRISVPRLCALAWPTTLPLPRGWVTLPWEHRRGEPPLRLGC